MAILGIDFGLKRIGLAYSNESGTIAFPGPMIAGGEPESIQRIADEAKRRAATEIVIGLPKNMDGTDGEMSARASQFADKLRAKVQAKVRMWDERLTSVQARRVMVSGDLSRKQQKARIDSMAAQLMLQSYLDSRARSGEKKASSDQ